MCTFNFCRVVIEKFDFKIRLRYGMHTVRNSKNITDPFKNRLVGI